MSSPSELPEVGDAAKRCQSQADETSKAALDGAERSVSLARWRSEVGNAAKRYKSQPDQESKAALDAARHGLAAATLQAQIVKVVQQAGPIPQDVREKLGLLLRGER